MSETLRQNYGIHHIMSMLPHRYPFLLLDRVIECEPGKTIRAYKNLTINEAFFQGHFPEMPVMPGVLILEAMAQAGGVMVYTKLCEETDLSNKLFLFTGIEKVRFRRPVFPGDRLELHCALLRRKLKLWKMYGQAFVEDALVAEAELTAAITERGEL